MPLSFPSFFFGVQGGFGKRNNITACIVFMVVMVMVYGECTGHLLAEQLDVVGIAGYCFRVPGAAHMVVKAHDFIRIRHDQMEIMRNHENTTSTPVADAGNETVKRGLTVDVYPLGWFIKDQQVWIPEQRSGQDDPLELSTRYRL